jgi:pimeloyl-ACP methyl ester carboxylesterase
MVQGGSTLSLESLLIDLANPHIALLASFTMTEQGGLERTKRMVRLSRLLYRALFAWGLLLATMMSSMLVLPTVAFAQSVPNQAPADASVHRGKLFLFVQGVDTSLSATDAQQGIISAQDTFGILNGPYPFLKATYPTASFLMYSYNGDDGKGKPTAYDCQDTVADKAIGYAPSNVLKTYALRLNTQLQHYLAGKPATDVYLIAHSQGGAVAFSYLAYLKSVHALGTSIPGTASRIKGVITLDSPIGGLGGGLSYAKQILAVFAHEGFPCPLLEKQHITLSSLKQGTAIYQDTRPPLGGRDSVMDVVFGQHITNQSLAEEAATHGMQILTVGDERDFLFGPQACNVPVKDFLSSQWIADEGTTSGAYGRAFAGGQKTCTDLFQLGMNHSVVLTDEDVHEAIEQLVDGRPVTALCPGPVTLAS